MINGKLVLDSKNTNYSYGSLQKILRKGLQFIGFERIKSMNHILVLGVAGGSVIKTLVEEIDFKKKITGIEIDDQVIALANTYFGLDALQNVNIIHHEAFEFVLKTKLKYDLIIIDIFEDIKMPNFLFEDFFQERIGEILTKKGVVLFNTMLLKKIDNERNISFINRYKDKGFEVRTIPRVEEHNELIIIEKV